jgi:hypothetical protein
VCVLNMIWLDVCTCNCFFHRDVRCLIEVGISKVMFAQVGLLRPCIVHTEFWRFSSERRCCICNKNVRGNVAAYKWKVHIVIPSQNHFRNFHIRHPKPKGLHKPMSSNELSVVTSLWKRLFPNTNKDIYSTSVRHGHLIQSQKTNSNKTQWVSQ